MKPELFKAKTFTVVRYTLDGTNYSHTFRGVFNLDVVKTKMLDLKIGQSKITEVIYR
jgi:hypothetical protein